jgi:hypothetical protein
LSVASWFSDNLALAYPAVGPVATDVALGLLVTDAAYHHLALLHDGFFARGGITFGRFYADAELVYGPALNRAVALEHERAKYPRVVLDEASVRIARRSLITAEASSAGSPWRRQLWQDGDDIAFVNYLGNLEYFEETADEWQAYLRLHSDLIVDNLTFYDGHTRVYDKYRWLASYHDAFLATFQNQALIEDFYVRPSRPLGTFHAFATDIPAPDGSTAPLQR